MQINLTVILFIVGIAVMIWLIWDKIRQKRKLNDITAIYDAKAKKGLDGVIEVLAGRLKKSGIVTLDFLKKNRKTMQLEGKSATFPIMDKNNAVVSFFQGKPFPAGNQPNMDNFVSNEIKREKLHFLPVRFKSKTPCWEITKCKDDGTCKCRNKKNSTCWIESGKRYRGNDLQTFNQKTERCLNCNVFQPMGVFLVHGNSAAINSACRRINNNYGTVLKHSLDFERSMYSAKYDFLTSILNKKTLFEEGNSLLKLSERYKNLLSLCMFDIDHFKRFNDTYGHQTGDFILRSLTRFILGMIRDTDIFGRYGGEEFIIIFPNTDKTAAYKIAENIRHKTENNVFREKDKDLKITISMGIAEYTADKPLNLNDLIAKADAALYHSKNTRNRVTAYAENVSGIKNSSQSKSTPKQAAVKPRQTKTINTEDIIKI